MSEDFGMLYGEMVVLATKAGLGKVVIYLEKLARITNETLRDNEELRKENLRLHDVNTELHKNLQEQRKRLKPDGPLVSRKVLLVAVEILSDAGLFHEWDDAEEDLRYEIEQNTYDI